jgi:hypothetical protein
MKQCLRCGLTRGDDVNVCSCGYNLTKTKMGTVICPQCHRTNTGTTLYHCQYCGHSLSGVPRSATQPATPDPPFKGEYRGLHRPLIGGLGAILLFLGVFMPIFGMPIGGSLNYSGLYFQNGRGDGVLIIVFTLLAFLLLGRRSYNLLWLPGVASFGVLAYTYFNLQSRLSQAKREFGEDMISTVQLEWGWAILVVGAVLLLVAAAWKDQPTGNRGIA